MRGHQGDDRAGAQAHAGHGGGRRRAGRGGPRRGVGVAPRPGAVAVAATVAVLAFAGCGGSDRERAADAVGEYLRALEEGDAEVACGLLTRGARAELEDRSGGNCEAAMEDLFAALEEKTGDLGELTVKEVNASGGIATATVAGPSGKTIVELSREGDDWKVNSAPGA